MIRSSKQIFLFTYVNSLIHIKSYSTIYVHILSVITLSSVFKISRDSKTRKLCLSPKIFKEGPWEDGFLNLYFPLVTT